MKNSSWKKAAFLIGLTFILTPNAFGYIDMSTGSYLLQIAIAGFLGALFTFKNYTKTIKHKIQGILKAPMHKRVK